MRKPAAPRTARQAIIDDTSAPESSVPETVTRQIVVRVQTCGHFGGLSVRPAGSVPPDGFTTGDVLTLAACVLSARCG